MGCGSAELVEGDLGGEGDSRSRRWSSQPIGAFWEAAGPAGRREGKRRKVPPRHKGPRGWGGGAGAGRREWARTRRCGLLGDAGGCAPVGGQLHGGGALAWGSGSTQSSGQPSCWRVTPLSVAPTGGGGTVGNPENPGRGGLGGIHRCLSRNCFSRCLCPVLLLPISAGWPQFSSPHYPPHCHIAFPCGSPLILSPTFHPLLLG